MPIGSGARSVETRFFAISTHPRNDETPSAKMDCSREGIPLPSTAKTRQFIEILFDKCKNGFVTGLHAKLISKLLTYLIFKKRDVLYFLLLYKILR